MPAGTMPPPEPEPEPEPEADPPPPPPPPPAAEPDDADPPGLLRAEVTVAVDLAAIAEGTAERAAFEADFARDVAALLGVDAARVVIESIVSGSVVVTFAVLPGADGSGLPPSALEDAFAGGGVQLAGFAATGLLVEEDWNARMLDMLAVEIRDCDVCTPREEFAYTLLASGLGLLGVLGLLVFYCSCRGGPTTPGDCIEVIKCDCDYWDEIEKPFMPVFTGFQCAAYTTLCIWHWQLCLAEGQTVEGAFFVSLFILACFFLFLNVCCCICVRNNIEARLRTCCNFLFNLALNGAVGLAAVIGVSVTVLPEQPGQLLGSCSTMYGACCPLQSYPGRCLASGASPIADADSPCRARRLLVCGLGQRLLRRCRDLRGRERVGLRQLGRGLPGRRRVPVCASLHHWRAGDVARGDRWECGVRLRADVVGHQGAGGDPHPQLPGHGELRRGGGAGGGDDGGGGLLARCAQQRGQGLVHRCRDGGGRSQAGEGIVCAAGVRLS